MTVEQFRQCWRWDNLRPEMADRIQRFLFSSLQTIVSCTGQWREGTVLVYWADYAKDSPCGCYDLSAWGFRSGPDDLEPGEVIVATCISR